MRNVAKVFFSKLFGRNKLSLIIGLIVTPLGFGAIQVLFFGGEFWPEAEFGLYGFIAGYLASLIVDTIDTCIRR
jgi:hypothetical protein